MVLIRVLLAICELLSVLHIYTTAQPPQLPPPRLPIPTEPPTRLDAMIDSGVQASCQCQQESGVS